MQQTLTNDTEQVIEAPKISCPVELLRAVLTATQMAEQLVDVPVVSASSCVLVPKVGNQLVEVPVASQSEFQQHSVEQNVDIPVQCGGGRRAADLQGFVPGQSPTARGWLDGGGPQGFHPGQGSTALRDRGGSVSS